MSARRALLATIAVAIGATPLWLTMGFETATQREAVALRERQLEAAERAESLLARGEVDEAVELLRLYPGDDPEASALRHAIAAVLLRSAAGIGSRERLREVIRLRDGAE